MAPTDHGFAGIFASPTLVALLRVFLLQPDQDFYQRELVTHTGSRLLQVQRDLRRLEDAGLIRRRRRGNRVYYQAAADHPAFADLQRVLVKTVGVADVLRDAVEPLLNDIQLAFVFGSVAEGRATAASDIDVLVVTDADPARLATLLAEAGDKVGREVNPVVYAASELRTRVAEGQHFLSTVLVGPKIWLVGDQQSLDDLVAGTATPRE